MTTLAGHALTRTATGWWQCECGSHPLTALNRETEADSPPPLGIAVWHASHMEKTIARDSVDVEVGDLL